MTRKSARGNDLKFASVADASTSNLVGSGTIPATLATSCLLPGNGEKPTASTPKKSVSVTELDTGLRLAVSNAAPEYATPPTPRKFVFACPTCGSCLSRASTVAEGAYVTMCD